MSSIIYPLQLSQEEHSIISGFAYEAPGVREIKTLSQGHPDIKWWTPDLNPWHLESKAQSS